MRGEVCGHRWVPGGPVRELVAEFAMITVAPAQRNIEGIAAEVGVGHEEGCPSRRAARCPAAARQDQLQLARHPAGVGLAGACGGRLQQLRQIEQVLHLGELTRTADRGSPYEERRRRFASWLRRGWTRAAPATCRRSGT